MFKLKWKIKGFTLAEVIIICTIFAVMIIWLILAINRSFVFIDNTRLSVRASNLAREWVEMMYNLRDSNRRKYSWEKDKHRIDAYSWSNVLSEWVYVIKEEKTSNWDPFIYLTWLSVSSADIPGFYDIGWFFSDDFSGSREESKINFIWTYSYYSGGNIETWNIDELVNVGWLDFYRIVRVYGIFCKNNVNPDVTNGCPNDSDPKEMRFCVKVFYRNSQWQHAKELCSIMTNFME